MSKFLINILFLFVGMSVWGNVTKDGTPQHLLIFRQIDAAAPWLQSGNAAGLSQKPDFFPSELKLEFGGDNGNFHSVFEGKSDQLFGFSSQSFQKIRKTSLYGSFNYNRSFEKGMNFSNTDNYKQNYPYLMADTTGNDTYHREFFSLKGTLASPINSSFDWGIDVNYRVGVAAQNRDPRSENKVLQTTVSPGILFKQTQFKLGANLTYGYYNEDIDVSVVKENADYTMFQLHGPESYTYHSSSSFFRLYQQSRWGGGLQFEWTPGKFSNILYSDYIYSIQTVDDGRAGGLANWSAVKNDARMDGVNWSLTDVFSVNKGSNTHRLKTKIQIGNRLGTEYVQRLGKVGETTIEHWITYATEQKYYSLQTNASLNYQLMQKDENNLMKSLLNAGISYLAFDEKYYLPNRELSYSNIALESSFLKLFVLNGSDFSAEIKVRCQLNVDGRENLDKANLLVQKIWLPELNYLTENYFSPGFSVGYQLPGRKMFGKYFIQSDFDWYHSASGLNRVVFGVSTGLIF